MKLHSPTTLAVRTAVALATTLMFAAAAQAQTQTVPVPERQAQTGTTAGYGMARSNHAGDGSYSLLPYTRSGYVGINLGKPELDIGCGTLGFPCKDAGVAGYIYTGGLISDWVGMELGYFNGGRAERADGNTRTQGINLGVVLRAPMGMFNAFVKGGGLYGETRVSADALSTVGTGTKRGWGAWYGAGVGVDFTPTAGVVLVWNRRELRMPGEGGRRDLDTTSLGYVHRF